MNASDAHTMVELRTLEEWRACLAASEETPQFIFKHSTACPISGEAYDAVQSYLWERSDGPPMHMVKVIESRPVSNAIAEDLDLTHKSPQLILVDNGEAQWSASHHAIYADGIHEVAGSAA